MTAPYQRDYEKKIKLGVIGLGSHCYRNLLPVLHNLPVNLQAFCEANAELLKRTAEEYRPAAIYTDAAEMYAKESLDAVLICVSPKHHPPLAIQAFRAGVHAWMEKPVAMYARQVEEMIEARGDLISVVGYKKAFMPTTRKVAELLKREALQPVGSILAEYPVIVPPNGQRILNEGTQVDWLANGCHPLSLLLSLSGPIESVTVYRAKSGHSTCLLQTVAGFMINLHSACGAGASQPCERYTIFAQNATLTIENCTKLIFQRGVPYVYGVTTNCLEGDDTTGAIVWEPSNTLSALDNKDEFSQGIFQELQSFCRQILTGTKEWIGSLEFALELMKIYEASLLSEGNTIYLG